MESNLSGLVPAAGLVPALPPAVTLGLTAAYTTLYALLFFSVYAQLWLVLLYGHKRLSYQTVFLALCLLWAALRTTLFSFYFRDTPRANHLGPLPFWLLYCCPVCLQFFTLTLMNLYFAQVVFKAKAKRRPEMSRGLLAVRGAFVGASLLFLLVNVLCAVLSRRRRAQPWALLLVRVLVSDSLFVICALSLAACLCLVARRAPSTSIYLEAKGTSVCQAAAMGAAMVLLYASRACYNLAALALAPRSRLDAFDYDWYNVSDQSTSRILNGQVFGSRSYFFDRAGHCEDEGCSWEHSRGESTRCQDQAATTTVSTPPHRRESPPFPSPKYSDPSLPHPRPLCQVHMLLLAPDSGAMAAPSSDWFLVAPVVVSLCHPPKIGAWPWLPDAHSTLASPAASASTLEPATSPEPAAQ
ncbi:PREDICTED: integral membrane protein GPR137 isoform X2 [Galeopterus variegatus]|uniref:Integral membrane protein GPR137 isoform X2 n=1 Tax=Galeopterus variegatus TaxID=482537 RepID=A0ABM0QB95_GALVR|nr:PREDICTED: integral membrane protein GPR137 isoform X2 [Galeopterus variegatus]